MTPRRFWLAAFWLAVLAGTAASLSPSPRMPDLWFPGADKLQHAVAYAALFVLGRQAGYRAPWALPLGLLALGAAIEVAQEALTATRSAEWLDVLADAIGIACGHGIARWAARRPIASTREKQVHRG